MSKTILFAFAHPDDESFTCGGTILELSKQKDTKTILYSATAGDAGKCGEPPLCTRDDLANVRRNELQEAAAHLGINELVIDDYPDGKLSELTPHTLKNRIITLLNNYQPDAVVTFPPHGLSGHSDHTAIQEACLEAVQESPNSVKELYYATLPQSLATKTGNPAFADPDENITLMKSFTEEHMKNVQLALLAHKTQHLSVERVFPSIHNQSGFTKFENKEYFIRAWESDSKTEPILS
ncbi:PIG-L deacetylase family protein [Alkalihalobacillus sp. CinArs1]|uniref:PIG-L deacetylase family protein n=1 Tax=Alkalihalobacillus sp. CinArs1 TaxID=2995314 RepID=UPI0022DD59E7|nr:PIG-L family deacetylase [Alkalihalobacillus sp. CinArs1]